VSASDRDLLGCSAFPDVREEGGKIVVDFPSTRLPENLERRLDVVDFATPSADRRYHDPGDRVRMTVEAQVIISISRSSDGKGIHAGGAAAYP
jgi:type II secretory pathway component HofQ